MGRVAESGGKRDVGHGFLRRAQLQQRAFEPQFKVDPRGRKVHILLEPPFERPAPDTKPLGKIRDRKRRFDILLHPEDRLFHKGVPGLAQGLLTGLRFFTAQRPVDHHDVETFRGGGLPDVALDEKGGEMRRTMPAGTCQPIPVHDKDLVRHQLLALKAVEKILMVEPTDATPVPFKQACLAQGENAGT